MYRYLCPLSRTKAPPGFGVRVQADQLTLSATSGATKVSKEVDEKCDVSLSGAIPKLSNSEFDRALSVPRSRRKREMRIVVILASIAHKSAGSEGKGEICATHASRNTIKHCPSPTNAVPSVCYESPVRLCIVSERTPGAPLHSEPESRCS